MPVNSEQDSCSYAIEVDVRISAAPQRVSFDQDGLTIFWKIDLYDMDLQFGSSNPEDPAVTTERMR